MKGGWASEAKLRVSGYLAKVICYINVCLVVSHRPQHIGGTQRECGARSQCRRARAGLRSGDTGDRGTLRRAAARCPLPPSARQRSAASLVGARPAAAPPVRRGRGHSCLLSGCRRAPPQSSGAAACGWLSPLLSAAGIVLLRHAAPSYSAPNPRTAPLSTPLCPLDLLPHECPLFLNSP